MTSTLLSFDTIEAAYPNGMLCDRHGCYYFLDQDGELAYFIKYVDGQFEPEPQYTDLDTLSPFERYECELIAAHIAIHS